jgi:hypothetical protein
VSDAAWKQTTIGWFGEYRGLTCRLLLDPKTDRPTTINWYVNWKLAESAPVDCTVQQAKTIAEKVIDDQIERGVGSWASAKAETTRRNPRYK